MPRIEERHRERSMRGAIARARMRPVWLPVMLLLACGGDVPGTSIDGPSVPPSGPVDPVPANLWQAPAGATPTGGSYVYLEMDPGFSPGVSFPHTIVGVNGGFTVTSREGKLTMSAVDAAGGYALSGVFQTMIGVPQLREGYYAQLRGQSQIDVLRGAFDVALNSRACDSPVGWVAIDHLFYFSGTLTTLDMRFEARCAGFAAPMHGQIRWRE